MGKVNTQKHLTYFFKSFTGAGLWLPYLNAGTFWGRVSLLKWELFSNSIYVHLLAGLKLQTSVMCLNPGSNTSLFNLRIKLLQCRCFGMYHTGL